MKNLLIFLFIPLLGVSQDYKDIMSIKSVDMFKKVVIENGYEFNDEDEEGWVTYGFNIERDSIEGNKSSKWGMYNKLDDRFYFQFGTGNLLTEILLGDDVKLPYDEIRDDIKKNCQYYKIINYNGNDYVSYSCSQSSYKGKIGFMSLEGKGYIRHFPKPD